MNNTSKRKRAFRVSVRAARVSAALVRATDWLRLVGVAGVALIPLSTGAQELPDHLSTPSQTAPPHAPPEASGDAQAPDWMVWRAFHGRMEHYQQVAPAAIPGLLGGDIGLSETDANVVLAAGFAYLDELELIDAQARSEIGNRFMPRGLPPRIPPNGGPNRTPDVSASELVPAHAPDGRLVRDVLAEEGFFDHLEQRRNSAFRAHWESLAESIGLYGLVTLEMYIEAEVAPNIEIFSGEIPVSPNRLANPDNRMTPR